MLASFIAALAVWILVPTIVLGWTPLVVTSGSMEPLIRVGDVVLVDPEYRALGPESVVAYESGEGMVVHRDVSTSPDGTMITKGDANSNPDHELVRSDEVLGVGRLLVPFIGMLRTASWVWVTALACLIGLTVILTRKGSLSLLPAVLIAALIVTSTGAAAFAASTSNPARASTQSTWRHRAT